MTLTEFVESNAHLIGCNDRRETLILLLQYAWAGGRAEMGEELRPILEATAKAAASCAKTSEGVVTLLSALAIGGSLTGKHH